MAKAPFQDPDLHTPAHDAIMVWLEENACDLIHGLMVKPIQDRMGVDRVVYPCKTVWEHQYRRRTRLPNDRIELAQPRYIDMLISSTWDGVDRHGHHVFMACEVKPVIRSVGELIRQLRQYEDKSNMDWMVAVVSPDDRFRAIIEKQGFIFIKAPQPEYGPQGGLF